MTNKEFQNILAQYPDDYWIQLDNAFGWETPSNKHKVDPHLYVNTDCGFIEIEPPEIRDIWVKPEDELPNDGQYCLVVDADYVDYGFDSTVSPMIYHADDKVFIDWDFYNDCEARVPISDVIAWMPIPKYYEGD